MTAARRWPPEPTPGPLDDGERAWALHAACRDQPDATREHYRRSDRIFYPTAARASVGMSQAESEKRRKLLVAEAKAVCARCPVTAECLAYALVHDERYGVWGGKTSRERGRKREG